GEVEAALLMSGAPLEQVDQAQALLVVPVALRKQRGERILTGMAEGCVPEVVSEGDGLCEVFVQVQRPRGRARDLRDLQRVGQAGGEVVALWRDEHLRLELEPPERVRVDDAVAVALVLGAQRGRRLRPLTPLRRRRTLRERR